MDQQQARDLLTRERARIELALNRLQYGSDDEISHVDQHLADDATALFETERDQSLLTRLLTELEAVERAEQRLVAGAFGVSVDSGTTIPDARLVAVPWAERTVEEQTRLDRY
jgi:RNA polymerase-binding transcription factor DksA